jgi:hypothetical protein
VNTFLYQYALVFRNQAVLLGRSKAASCFMGTLYLWNNPSSSLSVSLDGVRVPNVRTMSRPSPVTRRIPGTLDALGEERRLVLRRIEEHCSAPKGRHGGLASEFSRRRRRPTGTIG